MKTVPVVVEPRMVTCQGMVTAVSIENLLQ